jgi:cyclohexa-1,5-dienecarbonyl-CoA hydratase
MTHDIRVEQENRVATLTIDIPPLNVLNIAALDELDRAVATLSQDDRLQLLIVRGGGEKAFSGGVSVQDHTPDKIESMLASFHAGLRRLLLFPTPTLAAIDGYCLGGGMELAAACDLRYAAAGCTFGQPEIELGCYPPWAATQYPGLIGLGNTVDLLLTGRTFDTAEAVRLGFVHREVEPGHLDAAVAELSGRLTSKSAPVSRLAIRAIRAGLGRSFDDGLSESERIYTEEVTRTADMTEGFSAFLQKRRPEWKHR